MSSAWKIELAPAFSKQLSKLDRQVAKRISEFLQQRVALLDDPRSLGEALRAAASAISGSIAWATTESSATSRTIGWL